MASIFAAFGCNITATDAPPNILGGLWSESNQYGAALDDLFYPHILAKEKFDNHVTFDFVDMKNIPEHQSGYDFIWSSCALEHLGSLYASKNFIYQPMKCLNPGGIAVHTTEINLKSSVETLMMGTTCILRTTDLIEIAEHLEYQGHTIEPLDFRLDSSELYDKIDVSPYSLPHYVLKLDKYAATSFGLIIYKSNS